MSDRGRERRRRSPSTSSSSPRHQFNKSATSKARRKRNRSSSPEHSRDPNSRSRRAESQNEPRRPSDMPELTLNDFYTRSQEFAQWLLYTRREPLFDLPRERAISLFEKFLTRWNQGRVHYAALLVPTGIGSRTSYRWPFASEDKPIGPTLIPSESVDRGEMIGPAPPPCTSKFCLSTPIGTANILAEDPSTRYEREQKERKKWRREEKERFEEIQPKPVDPHEKRQAAASQRAGDRRAREADDGLDGINEYETGGPSIKNLIARRNAARERAMEERRQALEAKLAVHRENEDRTIQMLKELAAKQGYI